MSFLNNNLKKGVRGYSISGISLEEITDKNKTPFFLYDGSTILERYKELFSYIKHERLKIFYAMKANHNPELLKLLCKTGCGIDAVSIGEILLALRVGFPPERIIFTANNITDAEMDDAQSKGVLLNIGSISRLKKFCRAFPGGNVCLRFNPEVIAGENPKIQTAGETSKFGILLDDIQEVAEICSRNNVHVIGIHKHTGSGISDSALYLESMKNLLSAAEYFDELKFVDFGGGFKVTYAEDETPVDYNAFGKEITKLFNEFCSGYGKPLDIYFEPGKFLSAESGFLIIQVNTIKNNRGRLIAGTDSGFPHLIRPALYDAYHHIVNISNPDGKYSNYDICGNICESGDRFAEQRPIAEIREGDYLGIMNAGADCYSMAGVYNLRPIPMELILTDGICKIARKALSSDELIDRILEESSCC